MRLNNPYRTVVALVSAVLLVAGGLWYFQDKPTLTVSADFTQADGLFAGNGVRILGVPVGTVTATEPRGGTVRVTMSLPADQRIPEQAHAWVISPAVVSEKYVELGPAYESGPTMESDAVIPVERTHSPIMWDDLTASLNSLVTALGPDPATGEGGLGDAASVGARLLEGNGEQFRTALHNIAQASELMAGKSNDITGLLANLDRLVRLIADNQSTVDSLTGSVGSAAELFDQQRGTIAGTVGQLNVALDEIAKLINTHGEPLTRDVERLNQVSTTILQRQRSLTETLDTAPLGFDNWARAISDERVRIRLNISTNGSQLALTNALCDSLPIPLCEGPGLTNPIPFPPDLFGVLARGTS